MRGSKISTSTPIAQATSLSCSVPLRDGPALCRCGSFVPVKPLVAPALTQGFGLLEAQFDSFIRPVRRISPFSQGPAHKIAQFRPDAVAHLPVNCGGERWPRQRLQHAPFRPQVWRQVLLTFVAIPASGGGNTSDRRVCGGHPARGDRALWPRTGAHRTRNRPRHRICSNHAETPLPRP